MNVVVLQGALARPAQERELPSGDRLVAFEVTTRTADGVAATVPVVWMGGPACPWDEGEGVVVVGHVRRRWFKTGGVTQSRTEVLASQVVLSRQTKRVNQLLTRAVASLG
mgnify:CR=1 FL=1